MAIQIPQYLQTKLIPAKFDRQLLGLIFQPGVIRDLDMKVTATGGRSVSIATGDAFVLGNQNANQGVYRLFNDAAVSFIHDVASTNPRLDQIVARVYDSTELGSGADMGALEIVKGVEASDAGLNTRSGAVTDANLPRNVVRLADVLVQTNGTISIRDRRPWARGAYNVRYRTGSNYLTTGGGTSQIPESQCRLEITSGLVRVTVAAAGFASGDPTPPTWVAVKPQIDGADVSVANGGGVTYSRDMHNQFPTPTEMADWSPKTFVLRNVVAGSHAFGIVAYTNPGSGNSDIKAPISFTYEEIVRQNASNE